MNSGLGIDAKFFFKNLYENIEKKMVKSRVIIARMRLVVPSEVSVYVSLNEVHIERQMEKKVCIKALSRELNMSLPRAN